MTAVLFVLEDERRFEPFRPSPLPLLEKRIQFRVFNLETALSKAPTKKRFTTVRTPFEDIYVLCVLRSLMVSSSQKPSPRCHKCFRLVQPLFPWVVRCGCNLERAPSEHAITHRERVSASPPPPPPKNLRFQISFDSEGFPAPSKYRKLQLW